MQADRIENRINLFKGSVAVFFAVISAPSVVQYIGGGESLAYFSSMSELPWYKVFLGICLIFFLSFMAGVITGSFITRILRYKYVYQIGILDLAKQLREDNAY